MFDLPHIAARLYETPLLIFHAKLESIRAVLEPRLTGENLSNFKPLASQQPAMQITDAGIAVLPVMGTLVRRTSAMSAACGLTSYHGLAEMAEDAFTNPAVAGVLMDIDSCGGEAAGLFDLVAELRSMADATGKPLWAVANEMALSAAYGIACAADKIWIPQTAEVGSIGVVALHVDESKADEKAGLSYTYIHAGAHKVDGNPHEPLSDEAKNRLQKDVDGIYAQFVALVAKRRSCSLDAIQNTEAGIFRGGDAIVAGLADSVGTLRQAHDALAEHTSRKATQSGRLFSAHTNKQEESMSAEEIVVEAQEQPKVRADIEAAVCTRMTELSEIAAQAKRLGVTVDPVQAMKDGILPDALRQQVLKQAAEHDAVADIVTIAPVSDSKPAENRLLNAVKQLHKEGN